MSDQIEVVVWGQVVDGYNWPRLRIEFAEGFRPKEGKRRFLKRLFPSCTILKCGPKSAELLKPGYTESDPSSFSHCSPVVTGLVPLV